MNTIRNGKIARLPPAIREELNERLANHESGTSVLKWLNALPAVQGLLTADFGGKAINGYNLHEWRHGGHAEWRQLQEAREMMERIGPDTAALKASAKEPVTDTLATWLAARYAVAMKKLPGQGGDRVAAWNLLRECCHDVVALRRGEYQAQRLALERVRAGMGEAQRKHL